MESCEVFSIYKCTFTGCAITRASLQTHRAGQKCADERVTMATGLVGGKCFARCLSAFRTTLSLVLRACKNLSHGLTSFHYPIGLPWPALLWVPTPFTRHLGEGHCAIRDRCSLSWPSCGLPPFRSQLPMARSFMVQGSNCPRRSAICSQRL